MGYQESIIPVNHLSEVLGIRRAIDESEEVHTLEYLNCYCAARARKPLYRGHWLGRSLSDVSSDEAPIFHEGDLFAVIGGARLYQNAPNCIWIDCIAGIDEGYETLFEDIPLEVLCEQYEASSQSAQDAERRMRQQLNAAYRLVMHDKDPIDLPREFA